MMKSIFLYLGALIFTALLITTSYLTISQLKLDSLELSSSTLSKVPEAKPFKVEHWNGSHLKYVYLTFDDGPGRNTATLLDLLADHNVPATFFLLGESIQRNSSADVFLPRMLNEGHYIGLHSMTHEHRHLYRGPHAPENFVNEMIETQQLVSSLTDGFTTHLIRAPYGTGGGTFTPEHVTAVVNAKFKVWDWHVDSMDWSYTEDEIMNNIHKYTNQNKNKKHLVVLFHEKDVTLRVLPEVIDYYESLGYVFSAYDPDNHISCNFLEQDEL